MKFLIICVLLAAAMPARSGEKSVMQLKDFADTELKYQGIELKTQAAVHIKALGGGGDYGWTYRSDRMFAYGWIINAATREQVWRMANSNTSRDGEDRAFEGTITLQPGTYEVYFTAYGFAYHTLFSHMEMNIDHRRQPLFEPPGNQGKNIFSWFTGRWSDDAVKSWKKRAPSWGIELLVDESIAGGIKTFTPPLERPGQLLRAAPLGDNEVVRRGFELQEPMDLLVYAVGEQPTEDEFADHGWIERIGDRQRVWEMARRNCSPAGGARKNIQCWENISLPRGSYVLYYATDGSHSAADWNDAPPNDPLNWGITIAARNGQRTSNFKTTRYNEDENVIVSLTRVHDNEYRSEGFSLKEEAKVRVFAFGERSNSRHQMADYGTILDAKTRAKVWTMDVDRTNHAGGASKNRFIDEVITLPRGNYIVTFTTDDSHAYDDWNDDPPFDPEHYGITVMGAGEKFKSSIVAKFVDEAKRNVVAQILHPGNDVDMTQDFSLDRTTRVRVYAIGEGQNREMYDYGSIEDAKTGSVVWEMTYGMTFYAGGGRKNRMVNTTIVLERGSYRLRWHSDDSHSFGDWNTEPPEDQQFWGITLFRDEGTDIPVPPVVPHPPDLPEED